MRGNVYKDLEFWVERECQNFKSAIKRRVCSNPEIVFVNRTLLRRALDSALSAHPELDGKASVGAAQAMDKGPAVDEAAGTAGAAAEGEHDGWDQDAADELRRHEVGEAGPSTQPPAGGRWRGDTDDCPDGLIGMGVPLRSDERAGALEVLRQYVDTSQPDGWSMEDVEEVATSRGRGSVLKFKRGWCNGNEVSCEEWGKTRTRINHFIKVRFDRDDGTCDTHVAKVLHYLLVSTSAHGLCFV